MDGHSASGSWVQENRSTWDERAALHMRDQEGFYALDRFRAGEDVLMGIESAEIGDVSGKHVLHLQCHLGLDILSLARRGAIVTGLDFSGEAIKAAQELAEEAELEAHFVQANVYDAERVLEGGFDAVFVNWGSLNWLPDIPRWAEIVSGLLAPGGFLYLAEQHPYLSTMREVDGWIEPGFPWRTPSDRPVVTEAATCYTGDPTPLVNNRLHEWEHPLSEIIGSVLDAGLRLDFFHEHEVLPWQRLPMMVETGDRFYRLPDGQVAMPLSFSLKAYKTGYEW
ncbi:MAG: class I SAM-dependent methyltransferase [Hyphomicrobiales bacterium]